MRTIYFGVQHEVQVPGVVERGAIVGDGEFVNSLNVTRVFYGDCSVVRQRFEQRQISFAEPFGPDTINQLDHSQALFAEAHRHGHDGTRLHLGLRIHLFEEPRIRAGIRHHDNFTGLRPPASQTLPHFDANVLQRFGALAGGDLKEELALLQIHQEQRPGVRPQHLVDFFHDGAEDLIELQRRRERFSKLVKNCYLIGIFGQVQTNARAAASFNAGERFSVRGSPDGLAGDTFLRVWRFWGQPIHYRERFPVSATALTATIYNRPTAKLWRTFRAH